MTILNGRNDYEGFATHDFKEVDLLSMDIEKISFMLLELSEMQDHLLSLYMVRTNKKFREYILDYKKNKDKK
jgi:hypothetical protein